MYIQYEEWNPRPQSLLIVEQANDIIREYEEDGLTLTLRQLYYQFVSKDLIPNTERSYKNLGTLITKARLSGMISWEAIEDRNRKHHDYWVEENDAKLIEDLSDYIRYDLWERQDTYLEVWVEKEALGAVVARTCDRFRVPHMACKGYLSASEAWRAGRRIKHQMDAHKDCVIIHLGDHDPSGIDMTRDNQDRIDLFAEETGAYVRRIALNMDQVEEYDPPPNPAKEKDSRAKDYIRKFGDTSWELDALEPKVLDTMITNAIKDYIDTSRWNETLDSEQSAKHHLELLGDNWEAVKDFLTEL